MDPNRHRLSLTAKRTLLDSSLPIITKLEDVKLGMITHAVVFRTYEKHIMVEFYNNMKATIPHRETGLVASTIYHYYSVNSVQCTVK